MIAAYDELKADGLLYSVNGKGTFVNSEKLISSSDWNINWDNIENNFSKAANELDGKGTFVNSEKLISSSDWNINWDNIENNFSKAANELDIVKNEIPWSSDLISFKSISPDGDLFDMEEFKKSFMSRISVESHKLLNYGYAQGYKPLIDYLSEYMRKKGSFSKSKTTLVTNGFTEAFDLILSSFTTPGDMIICENPTHNTSIKIMKAHGIDIKGVSIDKYGLNFDMLESSFTTPGDMIICENPTHNTSIKIMKAHGIDIKGVSIDKYGLNFDMLEETLVKYSKSIKFAYLTPSYHNPTGSVMPPESRLRFYKIYKICISNSLISQSNRKCYAT